MWTPFFSFYLNWGELRVVSYFWPVYRSCYTPLIHFEPKWMTQNWVPGNLNRLLEDREKETWMLMGFFMHPWNYFYLCRQDRLRNLNVVVVWQSFKIHTLGPLPHEPSNWKLFELSLQFSDFLFLLCVHLCLSYLTKLWAWWVMPKIFFRKASRCHHYLSGPIL
jgi:hypothetical protein